MVWLGLTMLISGITLIGYAAPTRVAVRLGGVVLAGWTGHGHIGLYVCNNDYHGVGLYPIKRYQSPPSFAVVASDIDGHWMYGFAAPLIALLLLIGALMVLLALWQRRRRRRRLRLAQHTHPDTPSTG